MSKTAIIYARFSSTEQSKGFSLERQQTLGLAFATERGWTVEKTISDEGRSAFSGANRLEGSSLHQFELEARNGLHRGKTIIVEHLDRLSRAGAKAAAQLIWALNENGVDVATYQDGHIYQAAASAEMLDIFKLIILAQQSHEESDKKSKRTAATWEKRFTNISKKSGSPPVPHIPRWVIHDAKKGMVLNEYRTAVLNEIYDLYIAGVGIHRIVTILNDRAEPSWTTTAGKRPINGWFYSYVYRLLTKRSVLGEYVTQDGKTLSSEFYPQAVTAEKFNQAQAALALRKGNQKRSKTQGNRNLLAQLVVCDQCGGGANFEHTTDTVRTYKKVSGEIVNYRRKTYRKLRCDRARRKLACENNTILNYDIVEATILDGMLPELIDRPIENEAATQLREQLAEIVRLRDADQARLGNLLDALAEGGPKAIVGRIAALEEQIGQRTAEIETAQKTLARETSKPAPDLDVALIQSLRDDLTSDDDEVRIYARGKANMSLRRLIKRIAITGTGLFRVDIEGHSSYLFDDAGKLMGDEHTL